MRAYNTYEEMIDNQSINKQFILPLDLSVQSSEVKKNFHDYLIGNKVCRPYYMGKVKGEGIFYFQFPNEEFKKAFVRVLEAHFSSLNINVDYNEYR